MNKQLHVALASWPVESISQLMQGFGYPKLAHPHRVMDQHGTELVCCPVVLVDSEAGGPYEDLHVIYSTSGG